MTPRAVATLPEPKALGSLSPSRFTALQSCILKEACAAGTSLLPRPPKSFLGTIAHKLVEMGAKGNFSGQQKTPAAVWDALVAEQETKIAQNAVENHLTPLRQSCVDYSLIRARAIRAATQLTASSDLPAAHGNPAAEGLGYEIAVSSKDGLVKGRIDAVSLIGAVLTISDYKTGAVLIEEGGVLQIKAEYEAQLKLYAAIYHETFNRWPERLLLLNLQGASFEIPFSHAECESLLDISKETLKSTNEKIQAAVQKGDFSSLANPAPKTCRVCVLRPACKSYVEARQIQADADWPHDIWGRIESKTLSSLGMWAACLAESNVPGQKAVIRRLSGGVRHPAFQEADQGAGIAAFGLRKESGSETYAESPTTTIYSVL